MPTLNTSAFAFTGTLASINGARALNISKRRLMKFAVSVGLPILRVGAPSSQHAVALASYKALAMKCAIDFSRATLGLPAGYRQLDATEKVNISFWSGMVLAALVADEYIKTSRLLHAASFKKAQYLTITAGSGRRLADFVGQDQTGNWHVVEAKARQNSPSPNQESEWKQQAQTVASVQGVVPMSRSYALTNVGSNYSVNLVDPNPSDTIQRSLTFRDLSVAIIQGYYGSLYEWLSNTDATITVQRGQQEIVTRLAGYEPSEREYLFLGLTKYTMESLQRNQIPERVVAQEFADTYLGSDGIAITTSPTPELMVD